MPIGRKRASEVYKVYIECNRNRHKTAKQLGLSLKRLSDYLSMFKTYFGSLDIDQPDLHEPEESDGDGYEPGEATASKRLEIKLKDAERKNRALLSRIIELETINETILGIKDYNVTAIREFPSSGHTNEAMAIALLSDVHVEQRVDKKTVFGLNEYNPDIARTRLEHFFRNLLTLIRKERQDVTIDTLALGLLGDLIAGHIHEELKEDNFMSPIEATLYVQDLLIAGIKLLSDDGGFSRIIIPCAYGNHSRDTEKKPVATGYKHSYEWMMFCNMKRMFEATGYNNIDFIIPFAPEIYTRHFDKYTVRWTHGDGFRYNGGVGGIDVPLRKYIDRKNRQIKAFLTCMGHWHTMYEPLDALINGSGIGYDTWAQHIGARPEPPQHQFKLLHSRRGLTVGTRIFCD